MTTIAAKLAAKADAEWDAMTAELARMVHRAPTFTPAASSASSQQEVSHMSLLADIENDAKSVLAKLGAVDKAAYEAVDALKANPVAWSIFVSLATAAHVPDPTGTLNFVDMLLHALAGGMPLQQVAAQAQQQPAQQPQQAAQASAPQQQAQAAGARTVVQ